MQLSNEVVGGGELDVGVQVSDEPKLNLPLIQVAFEVEQKRLDAQLSAAERGTVADRQRRNEIPIPRARSTGVRAEGGDQFIRLDRDVGRGETKPPANPLPRLDLAPHRVLAPKHLVRVLDLTTGDEAPHLCAVQVRP